VTQKQDGVIILRKKAFCALHLALQRHLLRLAIQALLGTLKDVEMRHIEDMLSTLDRPAGRLINLPYGLVFVIGYDRYWLGREQDIPCPLPALEDEHPLNIPGVTYIPGWRVEAVIVQTRESECADGLVAYLDADEVGQNLRVRTWQRGDRFQPLGLTSLKKVGEFMIDEKIPRHWRGRIPIVASPEQIVWLVGYRIDERAKVTDGTKHVLRLEFRRV
jgi:tRNA(Ile)-lysidine synthase